MRSGHILNSLMVNNNKKKVLMGWLWGVRQKETMDETMSK